MLVLAYGRTGQRVVCPHRGEAVPSASVLVTVYDDGGNVAQAASAATKGALSTTLASAAVQGVREIVLSTTTGLARGDWLAVIGDDDQVETIRAVGVDATSGTVALATPLDRDYAAGDAVKSAAVYADLNLSETDTWVRRSHYQAVFSSTSWPVSRTVLFRIADGATDNPITYEDVQRVLPAVGVYRGADTTAELDHHREMAWRLICGRLRQAGRDPTMLRDTEAYAEAGGILAAALLMITRPGGVEVARALAGDPVGSGGVFAQHWQSITESPAWYDDDQDRERAAAEMRAARRPVRRGL